ncbi:fibronectin type III domain-containing protein [Hornefia butyriciproducens]|uniref:fibronectin type III domain-containing protein n=1 Tax=Hornefia butyriciproducens TaxID=2652293 RepID=UPI003F8AF0C6
MKIRSKSFALLLSLAMFFAYMPAFAFADDTPSGGGSESGAAVAQINDVEYATLPEAVAAAKDGDTITLLKDAEGNGVKLMEKEAKKLTFDFGGHTYAMNGKAVGSTGYESQAMHFEKGSTITLKNGTLKVVGGGMGIQNYANLTLQDFNVDSSMNDKCLYALSCNNGDIKILGNSSLKAAEGKNAFDVCVTTNYPDGARVTVDTTGEIVGNVQYDVWKGIPENNKTGLTIKNGKFNGKFDVEEALKDAAKEKFSISGGTFTDSAAENYVSEGFFLTKNENGTYGVLDDADAVAAVGTKKFASLPEAVAAAKDGDTITLLKDAEGNGVKLMEKEAKKLTFDFGGHTYAMNGKAVGSTGYESQAMHFEKGSTITLKNGTLKVVGGGMGIQNYANLTLQDFNVDSSMNDKCLYALSCNNGDIKILGNSSLKAAEGKNAFDVCVTTNYPDGARVTVDTTGEIVGNVQYDVWKGIPENNKTGLTIKNGKFNGKFDVEEALKDAAKEKFSISGGTFTDSAAENYVSEGFFLTKNENGTYGVLDDADAVAAVGTKKFASLAEAVAAAKDGDTVTLLKDAEGSGVAIMAKDAKKLTFDFGGHTYTFNGTGVGSPGYETQAMHFEKGSTIILKNGTLKVASFNMGIQNYADLTLQDFNVDASMNDKCLYALSCNNGDIKILGSSSLKAAEGQNAFDVCVTTHFPDGARVTVDTTGEIVGNVQYDVWGGIPENNKTGLTIKNGKFSGKFDVEEALKDAAKEKFSISGGSFSEEIPEEYLVDGFSCIASADGTYGVVTSGDAVKTLKEEKAKAEADAKAAQEALTKSNADLKAAQDELAKAKTETADAKAETEQAKKDLAEAQKAKQEADARAEAAENDKNASEAEKAAAIAAKEKAEKEALDAKADLAKAQAAQKAAETKQAEAEAKASKAEADKTAAEAAKATAEAERDVAVAKQQAAEDKSVEAQADLLKAQSALKDAQDAQKAAEDKADAAQAELNTAKEDLSKTKQELATLTEKLDNAEKAQKDAEEAKAAAEKAQKDAEIQRDAAKKEAADAKAETEQAKKDLAEAQKAKQEADARAEAAENDKTASETEKAAAIAAKEKAEKEALDAKADLAKAQAAQKAAEAKQAEAEAKASKAEADKTAAEAAKATAEAERDAAVAKQQAAEDKSAKAQDDLTKALDALKNAQDAQKSAEDKADAAQAELNKAKEDLSKTKQELATLTEKLDNAEKAQKDAEEAKAAAEKAQKDAEAQRDAAKKEAADAKAETEQAKKDLAEAQKAKQEADAAAQKARDDKTLSDQEKNVAIGEAKTAKETLQKTLDDLEAAKVAQGIAEQTVKTYEAEVARAEADKKTAEGKLLTAQTEMNKAIGEKEEVEKLLAGATTKLTEAETARQKAEKDLKAANDSLQTLQTQLAVAKAKAEASDKQLKETQDSLEAAKKELDEAKKANAANEERIRQLEAELAAEKAKNAAKPAAPAKSSISKLAAGKKKITVTWKKVTGIKGYQLQYSTSKSFSKKSTKSKTVKSYKTTKMTISKLKAKKYYYVRVRTYKTVDGKTVYSGWSASKKAKTK